MAYLIISILWLSIVPRVTVQKNASSQMETVTAGGVISMVMGSYDSRAINLPQQNEASVSNKEPSLSAQFFNFITHPLVMMFLILIVICGLVGEFMHPGAIAPGVSGGIALVLLIYAATGMPLNWVGFLLIVVALALFVAEAFTPTFGILITGGALAMFFGLLILFNELPDSMSLSWGWPAGGAVVTALFFGFIGVAGLRAQFSQRPMGNEGMVGMKAVVVDVTDDENGRIIVRGEYWNAKSMEPLEVNDTVVIEEIEGLTAKVKKVYFVR